MPTSFLEIAVVVGLFLGGIAAILAYFAYRSIRRERAELKKLYENIEKALGKRF